MTKSFLLTEKRNKFTINAQVTALGNDVLIVFYGGKLHIGAVGMAQPRPSLKDPEKISASSSIYTYSGHKEDVVVKAVSEEVSKRLNKRVVVVAGIHWDELSSVEIEIVMDLCRTITEKAITEVHKWKNV